MGIPFKKNNHNRRNKLTDGTNWNVSKIIEMLDVEGVLNRDEYNILTDLRRNRNDLVHEGEIIDHNDAKKML